jgi:SAM-dependent methyltransferase
LTAPAACPACASGASRPALRVREFAFRRCRECATLFAEAPPSDEESLRLYRDDRYFANPRFAAPESGGYHGYRAYVADRDHHELKFARILTQVERFASPGDLLDVGAGPGFMLSTARARGWRAVGVDPNPWAARFAGEELGVDVRPQRLHEAAFEDGAFDAVTMLDVLEHVSEPARLVAEAARVTRPGGVLAVFTPDAGSPVSRTLGARWPEVQRVPEHLVLFSARGLARLLKSAGYRVLGWHSIGKSSTLATLAADVTPVAPAIGRRAQALLEGRRLGGQVIGVDPRTKLCLYAQLEATPAAAGRSRSRVPGSRGADLPAPEGSRRRAPRVRRLGPPPPDAVSAQDAIFEDLELLSRAQAFCDWVFDQYAPSVRGCVAEVGAGIGTFTERILERGAERVVAIEPEPGCAEVLERRFAADARVAVARELLPEAPSLAEGSFDLVVCQNVLEHVADHEAAVAAMGRALGRGGELSLLVPAHPRLYGPLDAAYGHERRYTPEALRAVVKAAGLEVLDLHSFNLLGVPGWVVKNRRPGNRIGAGSLTAYELLVRAWRPVEERLRPPWGLSLVVRARRPG